jgi:uncharacterized protein (DUF736 family)
MIENTNSKKDFGFLIRIKNKKTDRHPDMEGTIQIAGVNYVLAGWVRVSKNGNRYLSVAARLDPDQDPPDPRNAAPEQQQEQIQIPF